MKVLRIIILLMIVINCYDPEMTKKQCKEQLIKDLILTAPQNYESFKKEKEEEGYTLEEINKAYKSRVDFWIIFSFGQYIGCMGQTVNCGTPVDFILHLPDCVEEIK
ncbi:MAG: hypothetical protein KatS3mg002_1717 [Candidatus Woesearchaeota archaeon]|nr:MAG: hypothetical protein KatS3mg002_1717 [Candidatus Woesearchaeota archaeon]